MRRKINYILITGISLLLNTACSEEETELSFSDSEISFGAFVEEGGKPETRANTNVKDIGEEYNNTDFFIAVEAGAEKKAGKFWVASGTQGMLSPKTSADKLKWKDRTSDHYFWAWTCPMNTNFAPSAESLPQTVKIEFKNSGITDQADPYFNNRIYENLLGASYGGINYNTAGSYVPLQFRHMVSRIKIRDIVLVDNLNNVQITGLNYRITIYGLPSEAYFHIGEKSENGNEALQPYVKPDGSFNYDLDQGVTYYIDGEWFYICPEMDFQNLSFKIEICDQNGDIDPKYGIQGAFYGDFKNIKISRNNNEGYDKGDGSDRTILHAGEEITISSMTLSSKGTVGVGGTLNSYQWNFVDRKASQHIHNGIYSDAEADMMKDLFDGGPSEEELKEFKDTYGSGEKDGKTVVSLYDDIKISGNDFTFGKDFVMDGLGHRISFDNSPWTIGNMFDVYICDSNNMIYIDAEGNIWTVDMETFVKTPTNAKLVGDGPFTIDPNGPTVSS